MCGVIVWSYKDAHAYVGRVQESFVRAVWSALSCVSGEGAALPWNVCAVGSGDMYSLERDFHFEAVSRNQEEILPVCSGSPVTFGKYLCVDPGCFLEDELLCEVGPDDVVIAQEEVWLEGIECDGAPRDTCRPE